MPFCRFSQRDYYNTYAYANPLILLNLFTSMI